jgi:PAS domain S-box-containing protein
VARRRAAIHFEVTDLSRGAANSQIERMDHERESLVSGSIQSHGLLLVVREPEWRIVQASTTAGALLRRPLASLLLATLRDLGGNLESQLQELAASCDLTDPQPLSCTVGTGLQAIALTGAVHRSSHDDLVVELEPAPALEPAERHGEAIEGPPLLRQMAGIVQSLSTSPSLDALAKAAAEGLRALTGYESASVFQLDEEGRGHAIAHALGDSEALPHTDDHPVANMPQRARELCLQHRVRVLVDANRAPSELVPQLLAGGEHARGCQLDLSRSYLRSLSPQHLQQLRMLGVVSTLRVSIVREGRLWGLLSCQHSRPRNLRHGVRAAVELLSEVMATRIAALENHARSVMALQARRLEQRLLEATAVEGDWRGALFRHPDSLLHPLRATGAVLVHGGEWLDCGKVPPASELKALINWIDQQDATPVYACSNLRQQAPGLAAQVHTVDSVLAVRLSAAPGDRLIWLREHGEPAQRWTDGDQDLAMAFGRAVQDISVQVDAVRLLIAESQLTQWRAAVAGSKEAVVVAGTSPHAFFANEAFFALTGRRRDECTGLEALSSLFVDRGLAHQMIGHVRAEQRAWHGELALQRPDGSTVPVAIRAEPVPEGNGAPLGFIFLFQDMSAAKRADAARLHLEGMLSQVGRGLMATEGHELVGAILANASLAAMDIAEGGAAPAVAPLLQEVEASTNRATALFDRMRRFSASAPRGSADAPELE